MGFRHPPPQPQQRPCDIYHAAQTPCIAAHSTVRSLYNSYRGELYTLSRSSDDRRIAIETTESGFADAAAQIEFCTKPVVTVCTIERIYDQSGNGNNLDRVMVTTDNIHGWPTPGVNAMRVRRAHYLHPLNPTSHYMTRIGYAQCWRQPRIQRLFRGGYP